MVQLHLDNFVAPSARQGDAHTRVLVVSTSCEEGQVGEADHLAELTKCRTAAETVAFTSCSPQLAPATSSSSALPELLDRLLHHLEVLPRQALRKIRILFWHVHIGIYFLN